MPSPSRAILCPRCRQLISSEETACPSCGTPVRGARNAAAGLLDLLDFDVSFALTGVCVLMYVGSLAIDPSHILETRSLFDLGSPTGKALYTLGMTGGLAWQAGCWWTLLTASFLHGGLLHIFFNLSWLRQLYPVLEHHYGKASALLVFLLTGAGGFILSNLVSGAPTIGASASLFGIFGALIGWGKRRGGTYGANISTQVWSMAIPPFLMGLLLPNVNNWGHLGGFIAGIALAWALPIDPKRQGAVIPALAFGLLALTAAGVALSAWRMLPILEQLDL